MRPAVKKSISVLAAFFAVWLAARFLLPLCFPFLLGALLAFAAEPMVGFLQKRRVPRCVCSGIGVSMAFCFLAMLVLILCAFALRELRRVARGPVVVLTLQIDAMPAWQRDLLDEGLRMERDWFPTAESIAAALGGRVRIESIPTPADCADAVGIGT